MAQRDPFDVSDIPTPPERDRAREAARESQRRAMVARVLDSARTAIAEDGPGVSVGSVADAVVEEAAALLATRGWRLTRASAGSTVAVLARADGAS